ncbi:MAG: hypothetical protein Q9165_008527 [Trypethelium subeluteriae]
MSGALPEGAEAPSQDNFHLVRDMPPIDQSQGHGSRGHLIAAAYQKDERLRISQLWRCGPRAFVNDILRREVSRRLRDGEEIRLLDQETVAFLEEQVKDTSLEDAESSVGDRGRRRHRHEMSQSREVGQVHRGGNDGTRSRSAAGFSAPSTSLALSDRPNSVESTLHSLASGLDADHQSDARSHGTEGMLVRYGDEPVESQDTRYGSRSYRNIEADEGRPLHSATTVGRGDSLNHLGQTQAADATRQGHHSRSQSVVPMSGPRSTVASTRHLATWTEADDSGISITTGADDEQIEQECRSGRTSEPGRARQRRKVRAKVPDSERRRFYQLGRRRE